MTDLKSYRDLIVWQRAMDLSELVYLETRQFPKEEVFGLTSQMRRSSVSVPSNIAEGHSRNGTKEFLHFISISQGSLAEVETQILLAERFEYIAPENSIKLLALSSQVSKMLATLKKRLNSRQASG